MFISQKRIIFLYFPLDLLAYNPFPTIFFRFAPLNSEGSVTIRHHLKSVLLCTELAC